MRYDESMRQIESLRHRYPLRIHMAVILIFTALSGILISKIFLTNGVYNVIVRYPLVVLVSYLIFLVLIKLWLKYVALRNTSRPKKQQTEEDVSTFWSDLSASSSRSSGSDPSVFSGGGGGFSGGGASSSYNLESPTSTGASLPTFPGDAAGSVGEYRGRTGKSRKRGSLDKAIGALPFLAKLAFFLSLIAIITSLAYVIYQAPNILTEAAFEALLAVSFIT